MSWPQVTVGEVARQIRGVSYSKDDASAQPRPGYLPVLRAGNIADNGLVFDDLVFVPAERISPDQRVRANDVLVAASSGSLAVVGKAARATRDYEGGFGAFCKVLRPAPRVDPSYFAHFFRTPAYRRRVSALAAGININNLRNEDLDDLEIPLPPLDEQRRIAAILDKADALRAKRRDVLRKTDSLPQSIFVRMFDSPLRNPLRWPLTRLADLGSLDRGISKHRPRNAPELLGGPYPFVQTGDIANSDGYICSAGATYSEIGLRQSKLWPQGTLCITIAANIARAGILMFPACFPDSVVGFRSDNTATVEFVRVWLSFLQSSLEALAPESAQKNINLGTLRELKVPLPPLSRQRDFAERVWAVRQFRETQIRSTSKADALFASLQHRAFRGEL